MLLLLPLMFSAAMLNAHPHMFIDSRVRLHFDSNGMTGFTVEWLFDPFFTSQILLDYDSNRNGRFEQSEVEAIEGGAFSNLVHYNYFTSVAVNGKKEAVITVSDFDAFIRNERLGYRFYVPFPAEAPPAGSEGEEIRISIFDDTFFCDIAAVEDQPVRVEAPSSLLVEWEILRNSDAPIRYDPATGQARREGIDYSGTVYPEELRIFLSRKGG